MSKARWHTVRGLELGIARYDFASQFVSGKAVLDVACGEGIGIAYLLRKGARVVCGGDISIDSVRFANKLAGPGCSLIVVDACCLPFKAETFDVIVSIETIEHLNEQEKFLTECRRALKEDGWFVCSTVNRESFSQNDKTPWLPGHTRELSIKEFSALLGNHFQEVTIYGLPWDERFGKLDRLIYRHETLLKTLLLSFPPVRSLVQFVTRWLFPRYHLIRLDQVEPAHLERFLTSCCEPFVLKDSEVRVNPAHIIAVARK